MLAVSFPPLPFSRVKRDERRRSTLFTLEKGRGGNDTFLPQSLEEAFWGDGQVSEAHACGVVDGVGDGCADGHDGRLSDAFGSKGTKIGGDLKQDGLDVRYIIAMRQGVIHEVGGQQLAISVVDDILKECPAEALRDA